MVVSAPKKTTAIFPPVRSMIRSFFLSIFLVKRGFFTFLSQLYQIAKNEEIGKILKFRPKKWKTRKVIFKKIKSLNSSIANFRHIWPPLSSMIIYSRFLFNSYRRRGGLPYHICPPLSPMIIYGHFSLALVDPFLSGRCSRTILWEPLG